MGQAIYQNQLIYMNEEFTLSNGKTISFYSGLSYNGINISLNEKLTGEDLELFKKEIKSERDVVSITNKK